ncbi:hypothetical protein GCM10023116_30530 [Kistimonas scapharcae]|uniref:Sel1 repeat family protein n=1 Tax=Kistimonas scapharcae TaxID=1036133 RepID=A0ABP8V692_9GAMM
MKKKESIKSMISWWILAAKQGDVSAQCMLGHHPGWRQDFRQAAYWQRKALKHNGQHQRKIHRLYCNPKNESPANQKQLARWYKKYAREGHAAMQTLLAIRYAMGKGVPENHRVALYWYKKAAVQNQAEAQYFLGMAYASGAGTPVNYKKACLWFSLAIANGIQEAVISQNLIKGALTPELNAAAQEIMETLSC